MLLPAVQFKPFTIPFPGLFPETWHESETVVKWEIHLSEPITIYWNSTCKGIKIRLWFTPNAEVKDIEDRISGFIFYLQNWTEKPLSIIKLWCLLVYLLCPRFRNLKIFCDCTKAVKNKNTAEISWHFAYLVLFDWTKCYLFKFSSFLQADSNYS